MATDVVLPYRSTLSAQRSTLNGYLMPSLAYSSPNWAQIEADWTDQKGAPEAP